MNISFALRPESVQTRTENVSNNGQFPGKLYIHNFNANDSPRLLNLFAKVECQGPGFFPLLSCRSQLHDLLMACPQRHSKHTPQASQPFFASKCSSTTDGTPSFSSCSLIILLISSRLLRDASESWPWRLSHKRRLRSRREERVVGQVLRVVADVPGDPNPF